MGIRLLLKYILGVAGSYKTVSIIEEGQKHRELTGEDPVLIINLWTHANHYLNGNLKEQIIGGRLNQIRSDFEAFLLKLRDNGFKFVFVFKKAQIMENDFAQSVEDHYKNACRVLDVMESLEKTDAIERYFIENPKVNLPFNFDIMVVLVQVARKYGDCFAIDKGNAKPSSSHVLLSKRYNALAIMGIDTYYVFYRGSWKFWADNQIDTENMTIREYNKELILASMGLTVQKAPLFVALAGGLNSSEDNCKKIASFFWPYDERFKKILDFVNRQTFPITKEALERIVFEIFGCRNNLANICKDFRVTMDLMNPIFPKNPYFSDPECPQNDLMNYEEYILANEPIYFSPIFLDARLGDMETLSKLVQRWIDNTLGIFHKDKEHVEPQRILMKCTHSELIENFEITPTFDNFHILAGNPSSAELLTFVAAVKNPDPQQLGQVPREHLFNIVLVLRMIQDNAIKFFEAKLILRTIYDCKNGKVPADFELSQTLSSRALRVSFLYTKLFFILQSCLGTIGLKSYQTELIFDNAYFQKLYESSTDEENLEEIPQHSTKAVAVFRRILRGLPPK